MDEKTIYEELKSINQAITRLDEKLTGYNEYQNKTNNALSLSKENEKEIAEIQEKIKWLSRTITGALITGVIGIVFILIKMSIGIK